jgi:hypothetical protein
MIGVLVETRVCQEYHPITELVAQIPQSHLNDSVRIPCLGTFAVLQHRHTEEDHGLDAEVGQLTHLVAETLAGVLNDTREGTDWLRNVDPLADEERSNEIVDAQPGLGDEISKRPAGTKPARPGKRERGGHRRWSLLVG